MADAKQVAEVLGVEEGKLGDVVPETLFKDGQGPLSDVVDTLLDHQKKVKELSESVEFQKGEAKKAFDVRDQLKNKLRELETNGIQDEELKKQYQEATKTLATLEAEKGKLSEELEGLRQFKNTWEENTKSQVDAAIKQYQVPKQVAEMIKRMELQDQLPFLQSTFGVKDDDGKGQLPFAGKKVGGSGLPFEGYISEEDYEQKKGDKGWLKENRERVNKSMTFWSD